MTEFEDLYRLYFKDVYLLILGLSKDKHIAEEITEEAFFKVMQNLDSFKGECDVRVWLCQIAKNCYFSYLRKEKRIEYCDLQNDTAVKWVDQNVCIEQNVINSQAAVEIHRVLHKMQEPYKEVFNLRVFGELSFKEIADIFEKNENWACVTFHRAKSKIQKEIKNE